MGKTWLVLELAKQRFFNSVIIDFEQDHTLRHLFDLNLDPSRICAELEIRLGENIVDGKTLLFFDEIQLCPKAIMGLRYFYEERPGLHVIAAGSLLEFVFQDISFPVGRIQSLEIHPMTFSEFLMATGDEKAAKICREPLIQQSMGIHEFLIGKLRTYFLLGGMPECIKVYADTTSLKQAAEVQDEIISTFQWDFNKYQPKTDINCLKTVWMTIASQVGSQIKYTNLAKDFSIPTIKKAFESLLQARLCHKIQSSSQPEIPLAANASSKKLKALFLDLGLRNRMMEIDYNETLNHSNLLAIYRGSLAEQFIGQELIAAGINPLFYWSRDAKNSEAEVDFLIKHDLQYIPIEVKDGPSGKLRSLQLFREAFNPKYSIVFNAGQMGINHHDHIIFLPLYFAESLAIHGIPEKIIQS